MTPINAQDIVQDVFGLILALAWFEVGKRLLDRADLKYGQFWHALMLTGVIFVFITIYNHLVADQDVDQALR